MRLRIKRMEATVQNGIENLPFFAAAVVAANVSGVPIDIINWFSAGYVAVRVLYMFIYIWGHEMGIPGIVRTGVWLGANTCTFWLLWRANQYWPINPGKEPAENWWYGVTRPMPVAARNAMCEAGAQCQF